MYTLQFNDKCILFLIYSHSVANSIFDTTHTLVQLMKEGAAQAPFPPP